MDFDNYFVDCVRDEKHGEQFIIGFVSLAEGKMKRTIGPFDEKGVRAEMTEMGLTPEKIEDNIRRARAHADEKGHTE
jgi:hypothetical protein